MNLRIWTIPFAPNQSEFLDQVARGAAHWATIDMHEGVDV